MASAQRARKLGKAFILLDNLLVIFGFFMVFPLISLHFVDQLGWSATIVGLALAMRQFMQQGLGLFGGSLADRYGAKPLIVCGMLMRAAGFADPAYFARIFKQHKGMTPQEYRNQLNAHRAQAEAQRLSPHQWLDRLAASRPAGSGGV